MGRAATNEEVDNAENLGIPMTLGDPDAVDPNLDLVDDDEDEESPMLTAMQEQLDGMETKNATEREFLQNAILSLTQNNAAPAAAAAQDEAALALNLDDLPDPVEKREDFNKELGTRINKFVSTSQQNFAASVTAQNSNTQSLQDLENRFTRDHGELAKKPALFQAVMTQEVANLKNRGLDPSKFVFADPDGFLKKVAEGMRNELGLTEDDDLGDEETTPGRKTKVVNLNAKRKRLPRAKGVRAGSTARTPSKKTGRDKPTSFIDELKKQQLEMGIV